MFTQLLEDLLYNFDMTLIQVLSINKNIIQIYNNKNTELFSNNLGNVILKTSKYIEKPKRYDLVFEISIPSLKGSFLFIAFLDSYSMINTIGKMFSLA